MLKPIFSITPFTLLDYPDKTACILWFAGCNMRCGYCYNPEIVLGKGKISFQEALKFIRSRIHLLDAVVLSGGECTLHNGLPQLIREIKSLGILVKLDTNGSRPELIKTLLEEKLLDFVSLDFKAPEKKFQQTTGSDLFHEFKTTLRFLIQSQLPFEVRTTLHSEFIKELDFQQMLDLLKQQNYSGKYYLQNFLDAPETLSQMGPSAANYLPLKSFTTELELVIRN